jgi:Domain of unknown function (DUF6249)
MHPVATGTAIAVAATLLSISGVLIAIITSSQKRNQAKLDLLRSAIEHGTILTPELIDKVMHPERIARRGPALRPGQGSRLAGILVIAFGAGYVVMAYFIGIASPSALLPMLGVACLFVFTGIGLLVVSRVLRSEHSAADPKE